MPTASAAATCQRALCQQARPGLTLSLTLTLTLTLILTLTLSLTLFRCVFTSQDGTYRQVALNTSDSKHSSKAHLYRHQIT